MERIKVWEIGKPKYCNPGGKMKMVDIELNDEEYNLLKKIDFLKLKMKFLMMKKENLELLLHWHL